MIRLAIFLAALLLPQTPRASIQCTVVFFSNGSPVAGAEVELTNVEGGRVISRLARTAGNGQFSFSDLPAGSGYQIVARGTGFRPTAYGQRDSRDRWNSIALSDGQKLTDLRITVQGVSQLSGRVLERSGKVLAGATVVAMSPVYINGRRGLQRIAATVTNFSGVYRFSGLPPGRYYLRISPLNDAEISPLFVDPALFDLTATPSRRDEVPNNPEGYRTVYYPGVALETAQLIDLQEAQILETLDTYISKTRTGRLRGTVTDSSSSRRVLASEVSLLPVDRSPDSSASRFFTSRDGTFEIRAILPGMYFLNAVTTNPDGALAGRTLVEISGGESKTVDVRVSTPPNIAGRIAVEGLNNELQNFSTLSLILTPNVRGPFDREQSQQPVPFPSLKATVQRDGTFTLPRVLPGDYVVNVSPRTGAYIKSIRLGNEAAPEGILHVEGTGSRELEIVLGTDTGSLDGRVLDDAGRNARATRVVLVPEARERQDLYLATSTSATGRFQMSDLAPGNYTLFPFESAPDGAWMDPDFLKAYEGLAGRVKISPQAPEYVEVKVISQ